MIFKKLDEAEIPAITIANTDFQTTRDFDGWTQAFNAEYEANYSSDVIEKLVNAFGSQMLKFSENKFIPFLINGKDFITTPDIDKLIRLIGDRVISTDNLSDKNSIIYDNKIWDNSYEETKYYCQLYYWMLKNGSKLVKELEKLSDEQYKYFLDLLYGKNTDIMSTEVTERPLIKGGVDSVTKQLLYSDNNLNKAENIQNAIAYLDYNSPQKKVETEVDVIKEVELTDEEKANYDSSVGASVLNKASAQKLIKYLIDKYKINLG